MDAFVNVTKKKKIAISDVKTRVNLSFPKDRDSRGYEMQLSIYYQLLLNMIDGVVDMPRTYDALGLDPESVFSDGFLAEAGISYSATGVLTFDLLLEHNTLSVFHFQFLLIIETMATRRETVVNSAWLPKY
jgi:hypothetical protein